MKNHIICTKAKLLKWRLKTFQEIIKFDELVKSHFSGHCEECNDEAI